MALALKHRKQVPIGLDRDPNAAGNVTRLHPPIDARQSESYHQSYLLTINHMFNFMSGCIVLSILVQCKASGANAACEVIAVVAFSADAAVSLVTRVIELSVFGLAGAVTPQRLALRC